MINFAVPQFIGFGIARGTACCLYSGEEILDYSGHLLNLASRLNDLARPSGIVIDGNFLRSVLPENLTAAFAEQKVFLRGIAETEPVTVMYLTEAVKIPHSALAPLSADTWLAKEYDYTLAALRKLSSGFQIALSPSARSKDRIKITVSYPKRGVKGILNVIEASDFEYSESGPTALVVINMAKLVTRIAATKPAQNIKIHLRLDYVPKSLPRTLL